MLDKHIKICDVTLRDGNHALGHQISLEHIRNYCRVIDCAGVDVVEVGHGNGLGASSLLVGKSSFSDEQILNIARENLKHTKLGIHVIPGFATIERDLKPALNLGVDIVRVASHCTEADITQRHINFVREHNRIPYGVLMMSHLASVDTLVEQALKMESYGALGIIFMDSAGHYLPSDVKERVHSLTENLKIPIGFHAHNNLGLAVANSLAAIEAGATLIDGSARGLGAGSGNAPIEALVATLHKMQTKIHAKLYSILDAADLADSTFIKKTPHISSLGIVSGLSGVFSGFINPVLKIAEVYKVDPRLIFEELGKRKIIAGQEDLIYEVAKKISKG